MWNFQRSKHYGTDSYSFRNRFSGIRSTNLKQFSPFLLPRVCGRPCFSICREPPLSATMCGILGAFLHTLPPESHTSNIELIENKFQNKIGRMISFKLKFELLVTSVTKLVFCLLYNKNKLKLKIWKARPKSFRYSVTNILH